MLTLLQDKTLKQSELSDLRKMIEREFRDKVELEDLIMEKMRTQLTMDKASQYTDKLIRKTRERSRTLVCRTSSPRIGCFVELYQIYRPIKYLKG